MSESLELKRPEVLSELGQETLRRLIRVWFEFERRLARVPIVKRLDLGKFDLQDYQSLLLNLRPQVVEGARWISRCASSFDRDYADVRSVIIGHAKEEHRDYEVLESDYVASGGDLATLRQQPRNPGSEALHCFLMYRASQTNPVDLLGAMWIIEGLGEKMANDWAARVEALIDGADAYTRFSAITVTMTIHTWKSFMGWLIGCAPMSTLQIRSLARRKSLADSTRCNLRK